jgi:DNA polymerase-3 subunit alpha
MGKKIKAEMDAQRERFVSGAVERGVLHADAVMIFDLVAKFASYGFNKSHAAAYALIAYQTAYLKANFPVEFLAASMTLRHGQHRQAQRIRLEARRLGIEVMPGRQSFGSPSTFEGAIVYPLCALKGIGPRCRHLGEVGRRPFEAGDFAARIDRKWSTAAPWNACQAGASIRWSRSGQGVRKIGKIISAAQEDRAQRSGISTCSATPGRRRSSWDADPWPPADRLQREFAAIGTYLSAHPIDDYDTLVKARGALTWKAFVEQLRTTRQLSGLVAATVVQRQERRTRTGGRLGIITLSDPTAQFEATVYQERLLEWREQLEPGQSVLLQLGAEFDPDTEEVRTRIHGLEPLEAAAGQEQPRNPSLPRCGRADRSPGPSVGQGRGICLGRPDAEGDRAGSRGPSARPVPGDSTDRRRDQGGSRSRARRGALNGWKGRECPCDAARLR